MPFKALSTSDVPDICSLFHSLFILLFCTLFPQLYGWLNELGS